MRKRDSWLTVSTSGELFMMVLTLVMGRLTSLPTPDPLGEPDPDPAVVEVMVVPTR